jgi:hypothetical protein
MTMFVRTEVGSWRRSDELHDNVLIDTSVLPAFLASHGIRAELRDAFGSEMLPTGLLAVVGCRTVRP